MNKVEIRDLIATISFIIGIISGILFMSVISGIPIPIPATLLLSILVSSMAVCIFAEPTSCDRKQLGCD